MGGFCSGYAGSAQLKYVLFIKKCTVCHTDKAV